MKKIMFNDRYGLTEAVLSGRKTQTRRIYTTPANAYGGLEVENGSIISFDANGNEIVTRPKYKVGEVVAIAQSYKNVGYDPEAPLMEANGIGGYVKTKYSPGWTNKMFVRADLMPHHIRITNVRVERLQNISDEDCIKEGIVKRYNCGGIPYYKLNPNDDGIVIYRTPQEAYAALIDRISGKGTWESNPYVFVYDFELVK